MIILNRKVRFSHPDITYSVTNYTEYLFGAIGMKVNADIRIDIQWSTQDTNMKFLASDKSIERLDGSSDFYSDGFKAGDTVVISGTVSNNITTTIVSINADGSKMIVAGVLINETVVSSIFGETPITSMDFYPNLIENSAGFSLFNLTDRETIPKYYADTITTDAANPTKMIVGTNSKGWITPNDAATIYRLSFTNHVQTFVISHTFNICPIFLADQLANLQNGNPPAAGAFKDRYALKYVFTIDGKYSSYNPDPAHTTDGNVEFPKGQTGWFGEFLNGRPSIWTKSSILYYDYAATISTGTLVPLTGIDYCKKTLVISTIQSQNSIIEPNLKLVVMRLPLNEEEYINTATDYKTNFIYERAMLTSPGGVVQGENTGDYHFIKDVSKAALSGNRYQVSFSVEFSDVLKEILSGFDEDNLNYLIFITAQSPQDDTTILAINQSAVIMDVNKYVCDKNDSTLFQIIDEVQFFPYGKCNGVGYSNFNVLPMETILAKVQFHVKQGTAIDPIVLKNISANIIAVKQNDEEEFPLETFGIDTSGFLPNCDNIQEIFFGQDRDFILPSVDCKNTIRLMRMPTLDIAGYSAYEMQYPFKVRWEEWRSLSGANRCFSTPTQNWLNYSIQPGWTIKFSIKSAVEDSATDHTTEFEHITWGAIQDPCEIPYSVQFNTMDVAAVNDYEGVIARDVDTFVKATISGDFSGFTADQLYGIITLDAWGVGGTAYSQEIGTRIPVDSDGPWYGAGSSLVATLTKINNSTIELTAFLDYRYLPTDTDQLILSALVKEWREEGSSSGDVCLNEIAFNTFICGQLEITEVVDVNTIKVSGQVILPDLMEVYTEDLTLEFITSTTWRVTGGQLNGAYIMSGSVGGNIVKAPAHPYTSANVGDTLQGDIEGTLNTSPTEINGIGDMQIGCTFFVS